MGIKIHLDLEKKDLWLLSAIIVFLLGVVYVVAYGETQPSVMGHSINELERCVEGKILKVSGGLWTCADDNSGAGGGVTSLSAGTGITLSPNPITSIGTVSTDTNYLQRRVTTDCGSGQAIRSIGSTGTATCVSALPTQDIVVCGTNPTCNPIRATLTGSCGGVCTITSSSGSCTAPSSDKGGIRCQPN